jgi:hypothetical protein
MARRGFAFWTYQRHFKIVDTHGRVTKAIRAKQSPFQER